MMNKVKNLLITGATGGIGQELVRLFLERTPHRLFLCVRPNANISAERRVEKLFVKLGLNGAHRKRIRILVGDITRPQLGLDSQDWKDTLREIDEFYHSAALTKLGADWEEAEAVNVKGTFHALELAREARDKGRLQRFFYFSTAYVAGSLTQIHSLEDELPQGPKFANTYEATKFLAEKRVREELANGLPAAIFRPSIVVGDSKRGAISEFNVIYPFLRLFAHGLLKRLPARLQDSFNIVPIDFVVEASFTLSRQPESLGKTFHLVSENPPTLQMFLELREEYQGFPPVEVVRPEDFSPEKLSSEERNIFSTLHPYLGYLGSSLTFDSRNTRRALRGTGILFPRTDLAFLRKIVDFAIEKGYFLKSSL